MADNVLPENALQIIEGLGASSLPNNPTGAGFTAPQIKKAIDRPTRLTTQWLLALEAKLDTAIELLSSYFDSNGIANMAEKDADGNVIASTYATNEEAVHKSGSETITGSKSFGSSGSDNSKTLDIYFTINLRGPVYSSPILPGNTGFSIGGSEYGQRWDTAYVKKLNISDKIIYYGSYELSLPLVSGTLTTTSHVATEINKIKDGDYTAKKAEKDGNGNTITSTYETKTDAQAKVALSNLRSILGLASTSAQGLMSADDKAHLNALYALLGAEADSDSVVNTINEVLAIFSQYPEGVTLANALALKVAFSDVINNLTSNEISKPLSAYQGKALNDRLEEVEENYVDHDDVFAAAMFTVTDYDQSSGEITLEYSSSAITDITYNSSTGQIVFTY